MKIKYYIGALALAVGSLLASCDDEEQYSAATGTLVLGVVTEGADVASTSAALHGSISGSVSSLVPASYSMGFLLGTSEDALTTSVLGTADGTAISATTTGLVTNKTYYYKAFLTLQNKLTYTGEVKSFTTTDATITTKDATISGLKVTLGGTVANMPEGATCGVMIASKEDDVPNGIKIALDEPKADFSVVLERFANTGTYYYCSYADLGSGVVYGPVKKFATASALSLDKEKDFVDLGLSSKWAKCNIGASSETGMGGLFGYGDINGFNISTEAADYASADISETDRDVANALYNKIKIPTADDFEELFTLCKKEWVTVDGVSGYQFTGPNGNKLFLPAAGIMKDGAINKEGVLGNYMAGNYYSNSAVSYSFSEVGCGMALSPVHVGLSVRPVYCGGSDLEIDNSKIVSGHIETDKNNLRIEIFNAYGGTNNNPPLDKDKVVFAKSIVVKFKVSGITDNLLEGTSANFNAGLEYADGSWGCSYWAGDVTSKYDAIISGDGEYTVWYEGAGTGLNVFCIDIMNIVDKLVDVTKFKAEIVSIALDKTDITYTLTGTSTPFQNKDGNEVDGRAEIYNEYGDKANPAADLKFDGQMIIDFTITGIDGNLKEGASADYKTELSFADADWNPSYWGGVTTPAQVTKDGDYQVFAYLNGNCEGAVVWTIEFYNLWKDLVDPSKVQIKVNQITIPGKAEQ